MAPVHAQTGSETLYNVFSLSSEASADVDNDLMIASLVVQQEDKDPAVLADKVNSTMAWAVDLLRPYSTLKVKTRDYQTYPRYDTSQSRRLIGWRATQTLQLETDDFEVAGKAIQTLQEKLQVQGIRLTVKPATRKAAADDLIDEALNAFKERARLIQKNMGASAFKVLEVNVQSDQGNGPMFNARAEMADVMRSSAVAEPVVEAGTSQVSVQVYGRVQLD
ncbi:MAG: SIMPL domain-containing protein [Granulosicoccus sp.]|nr:SIMPL domain-containing protein [Granulosicoccus sp.]